MNSEEIDQLICNVQAINSKANEINQFLIGRKELNFEQIRNIYGNLEIICGKATTAQVFIEFSVTGYICPKCGTEKISINWDNGNLSCQNVRCEHQWSVST